MTARAILLLPALFLAAPAFADEIRCEGAFAADSSEARLIEIYGKDNVVTGEVDGPEGTTIVATTVFPNDQSKSMEFIFWDEANKEMLSYVSLPQSDVAPLGLKPGLTVKEVEAINGEPFTLTGFWWDYGGYAGFQSGKLAEIPGGCHLSVYFQPSATAPENLNVDSISGDVEVLSTNPLLETLAVKVEAVTIGYPFPENLEEPSDG
jgi:hypothetical protein